LSRPSIAAESRGDLQRFSGHDRLIMRRSRARAFLVLSRISNLPTVWSNTLAGSVAADPGAGGALALVSALAIAVSLMYTGGMFLNDAFDARIDAAERPDRPIPSGDVSRAEAFTFGALLLSVGLVLLAVVAGRRPFMWGAVLAAAIVAYDYRHKGFRFGPLVMGACRGLVYCVAGSVAVPLSAAVIVPAVLLAAYTASLTLVAKQVGSRAGVVVPLMIAGISLVDAAVILWSGGGALALVGIACFALTLALQEIVPGT
jgi:4-hydroxybenzoate polyprenyltransferase